MKLMKSLNFVKIVDAPQTVEKQLSVEQTKVWENVKQGFKDLKLVEADKLKSRPLQELLDEL